MLRWSKVRTVVRREYLSRVQTKAFWFSTLAVPILLLVFALGPTLMMERTGGRFTVAVVGADEGLVGQVVANLAHGNATEGESGGSLVVHGEAVPAAADRAAQRTALKRDIVAKRYAGVVVLPDRLEEADKIEYLSTNVAAFQLSNRIERAVRAAVVHERLLRAGLPDARIDALTAAPELTPVRIDRDLAENRESAMQSFFIGYVMMFLLWFTVMIYGMYVMRGVLEEKSSRIVEVVVANLSPMELMTGKILGVGAVGLSQYAIWVLVAMNLAIPGLLPAVLGAAGERVSLTPAILAYFVAFFVLGYALYSTIYAALGAFFNTEDEAHQMQAVAGWMMGVPFLLMFPILNNPNSTLSTVLSLIPFFSPMLFFLRVTVQTPPAWQIVLCFALLIGTIVLTARGAATVYRIGILTYGKRPTLGELWRWMRGA